VNRDQYASALSSVVTGGYAAFAYFDAPYTTQLNVWFSEAVNPGASYTVAGLTVSGVALSADAKTATVTLDTSTPLVSGNVYTLTVSNATTVFGNVLPGVQPFTFTYQPAGSAGTGSVLREYWTGISGTAVSDLTGSPNFPNNPSGNNTLVTFDATPAYVDWANDYGTRMRGYVCPPASGTHYFWISADETAELWLSTDEGPANKVKIAWVPAATAAHEWAKYPEQKSAAVWLGAGRRYYVEALQKEGAGADHLSVAWQTPGTVFNVVSGKPIAAGNLVPFDITPPTALAISRVGPALTGAASVQFAVTFSERVSGVDAADFVLATTGTAAGTPPLLVSGSGANYTVTVNGVTGNGALGLNLVDNNSIADLSGNLLAGSGTSDGSLTGEVYTIDTILPTVLSMTRAAANPTDATSLRWNVAFNKSVTGVDTSDFRLALSGVTGTIASVSGSATTYTVTATVSGAGTVGLNLADDNSIADAANNKLGGPALTDGDFIGEVYNVDTTVRPLMYWLKPIAGGTGDYSISGSYSAGDQNPDDAYVVSINSLPAGPATITFQLYASIGGRDGIPTNDTFVAGLLDVFNRPGSSALVGEPSPLSLRTPPFSTASSSVGKVNGDLDGDGGRDLGGTVSVGGTFPGTNSAWVRPFSTGAGGTSVNANGWTDILVGTISYTFNAAGGAAPGQWAQIWTKAVTFTGTSSGFNYAHIWKEDSATVTQRENDGSKIGAGPAVTIAVPSLISIGNVSRQEGNAGTTDFVFPITLSRACSQPVLVTVDTSDGTATAADNDYQAVHQVVTFAPGETSQTVTVRVNGDARLEADETFAVMLSSPLCNGTSTPAVLLDPAQSVGTGTIVNDDTAQNDTIQLGPNGDTLRIACRASDPTTTAEVFVNGASTPAYVVPIGELTQLTIVGGTGDDQVIVDLAHGSPLPAQGLSFDGGGAVAGDRVAWINAAQAVRVSAAGITIGAGPAVALRDVSFCSFDLQSPDARLTIDGTAVRLPPNQPSAITANTAVEVVGGGVLDLNGNAITVARLTVNGGNVLHGEISAAHHQVGSGAGISAGLHGPGALEKSDGGTAVLTGSNQYGGGTVISGGILQIGSAAAVPAGGPLTIGPGATLLLPPGLIQAIVAVAGTAAPLAQEVPPVSGALRASDSVPDGWLGQSEGWLGQSGEVAKWGRNHPQTHPVGENIAVGQRVPISQPRSVAPAALATSGKARDHLFAAWRGATRHPTEVPCRVPSGREEDAAARQGRDAFWARWAGLWQTEQPGSARRTKRSGSAPDATGQLPPGALCEDATP
jgi:autotransporter-associated beta strand protein